MFRRILTAALPLSALVALPAHAAPTVTLGLTTAWHEVGEGIVAVAECDATANFDGTWVPALTGVTCSINGVSKPAVVLGPFAATAVANATSAAVVTACVSGIAIFTDGNTIQTVNAGPICQPI